MSRLAAITLLAICLGLTPACASFPLSPARSTAAGPTATGHAGVLAGQVLGLDGKPGAGVLVRGYLVSNNAGSLNGTGAAYRTQDTGLEARTDANGRFQLGDPQGAVINVEAVSSDEVKAICLNALPGAADLRLQLDYTGTIAGQVKAAVGSTVTNFLGADVYVPGTSYGAKADAAGHFTLSNVAAGTFDLVASLPSVGMAALHGVIVRPRAATTTSDLVLTASTPLITTVVPANGGRGSRITLTGANFGASTGKPLLVTLGGVLVANPQRIDDQTVVATVPNAATTGEVGLSVDGVPGGTASFTVIASLSLEPQVQFFSPGGSQSYSVIAIDTEGLPVANPACQWLAQGEATDFQGGIITARQVGDSALGVSSGNVVANLPLHVTNEPFAITLAGSGVAGSRDGVRGAAAFAWPEGLAVDPQGNLYVADSGNNRIRRVTPAGVVTTVAGDGQLGMKDGPAAGARFSNPQGIAVDGQGNLYVADSGNQRIRLITPAGVVSTVAGSTAGNEDGPVQTARFNAPFGVAVDASGSIVVADTGNHRIRIIDPTGTVSTLAGNDPGYADGQGPSAQFSAPLAVVVDERGNVFVGDSGNYRLRQISPASMVSTLAGDGTYGSNDGPGAQAQFAGLPAIAVDADGYLYVADSDNNLIRRVSPQGEVVTLAGDGNTGRVDGIGAGAEFNSPYGVAVDARGNLYVADSETHLIRRLRNIR